MKPFRLNELPEWFKDWMEKSEKFACGSKFGNFIFHVKKFVFSKLVDGDCKLHDLCYLRGGSLKDKTHCDWVFFKLMFWDGVRKSYSFLGWAGILGLLLNIIIAIIVFWLWELFAIGYFIAVSVFGIFAFNFGKYKTLEDIYHKYKKDTE